MTALLLLALPALAVDPDITLYVASDAAGAGTVDALSGFDTTAPSAASVQADTGDVGNATAALALDPINGVLYARAVDGPEIYAFDATDLTRLSALDITATGDGGALEIDPFRRVLFAVEQLGPNSTIRAYSIDYGASYGTALDATPTGITYNGADLNHLVRDPANDALYAAQGTPANEVVYFDAAGQGFDAFTWAPGSTLGVSLNGIIGLALDPGDQDLWVWESSSSTDMGWRFDVSTPGSAIPDGAHTISLTTVTGVHWILDSSGLDTFAYSDADNDAVYLDGSSATLSAPGALEFYPLDEAEADDDGDGLYDSVELGATGLAVAAYNDGDPTTTTDPDDDDSDDDGLLDGEEDADLDGIFDAGETDPNDDDSDDDGFLDGADNCPLTDNPSQDDLDGDGAGDDCDEDADGDGYDADVDCDDMDAAVNPGATETWYDGVDGDCDGASDYDADADGHDSDAYGGDDCDDSEATTYTGATDYWYDGVDSDCAGDSDFDMDVDGYDSATYGGTDCDDADATTFPGAPDDPYDGVINDCDASDEYDADGDGYRSSEFGGTDCDDASSAVNPAATEVWYNGVDEDCDGNDDDRDEDGWPVDTDCDDLDPSAYPGAPGWDDDCQPVEDTAPPDDTAPPVDTSPPEDTSPPVDTSPPEDTADTDVGPHDSGGWTRYVGGGGCTCSAGRPAPGALLALAWLAGLVGLVIAGRRRG